MSDSASRTGGIKGSLGSVDGSGVVRLEVRFNAEIDDLWSAITDPRRLVRWHARVEGDLRPGGTFRRHVEADDWEGTGRIEVCEPPSRLVVTSRESEESWRRGQGAPPFDSTIEVSLSAEGHHTDLVVEVRGLPLRPLVYFGVGWHVHMEKLAAYLDGRELGDTEARWDSLIPVYEDLAPDAAG